MASLHLKKNVWKTVHWCTLNYLLSAIKNQLQLSKKKKKKSLEVFSDIIDSTSRAWVI